MNWIDIDKDLPENRKLVQIAYSNKVGRKFVTVGWYCRKWEEEDNFYDDDLEYCEEKDEYFVKEGWRSQCLESEYYYPISGVTHFAPLLKHPEL